jgi:hypothetical protein
MGRKEQISSGKAKMFRGGFPKALISLMAANQPFRGLVRFHWLNRVSFRCFRNFCPSADLAAGSSQSDRIIIISSDSENGKLLSTGKNRQGSRSIAE